MTEHIGALNVLISSGAGAPTHTAPKGSFYLNTTAASNVTRAYINTTGAAVWTAVNTVA
jgi:hypothetical protein